MRRTMVAAALLAAPLAFAGCFAVRFDAKGLREIEIGLPPAPPDPEKAIGEYFAKHPELTAPSKVTVYEFGTDDFSRIVADDRGPGGGDGDPLRKEGVVAAVLPLTGSSLVGKAADETALRLVSARAQADVLMLVDYEYRDATQATALSILNLTIVGLAAVPSQFVHTEVMGRATLVDVRNGLVYGIAQARIRGPSHFTTVAHTEKALEDDREALRGQLHRELSGRVLALLGLARERARK